MSDTTTEPRPSEPGSTGTARDSRPAVFAGVLGGLIGATCCIGPAVGVAIGAGAGSLWLSIGGYRPLLFAVGALIAFGVAAVLFARRRRSCPTDADRRALRSRWVDVALIAFALTYALGRFVIPRVIALL